MERGREIVVNICMDKKIKRYIEDEKHGEDYT